MEQSQQARGPRHEPAGLRASKAVSLGEGNGDRPYAVTIFIGNLNLRRMTNKSMPQTARLAKFLR